MDPAAWLAAAFEIAMRETALFAATGFLLLGVSDLAVDFIWIARSLFRVRDTGASVATLPPPAAPGRFAIFVPAWDEGNVVGDMLGHARAAFGESDYIIYVGCYPNDPATIAAVRAAPDPRMRLVVGSAGIMYQSPKDGAAVFR